MKATVHLLVLLSLLLICSPARAQVEVGPFEILQCGQLVGMIYAPAREPGAATYEEHWVLFPRYVYPGRNSVCTTELRASTKEFRDAQDFFAHVWVDGSRYVHVAASESGSKPPGR